MSFDPKTNKFPYPENTCEHYLKVKKDDGTIFDEKYSYVDASEKFTKKRKLFYCLLRLIVFPLTKIRLGLKVVGKENLKKYSDVIDKGIISVTNHVHLWDYLAIMTTIKPRRPYVISWANNIRGENGKNMRLVGGIPIPDNSYRGTVAFLNSIHKTLDNGGWLQVYAEGSMWEYYKPIRPFKDGAAKFAINFDKPILPMAFSYRKPSWIRRIIFRQIACFTLNIGEPIYTNNNLEKIQQKDDLLKRTHDAVCILSGVEPDENIYDYKYMDSKRIDYYTDTYGVGYKGSH